MTTTVIGLFLKIWTQLTELNEVSFIFENITELQITRPAGLLSFAPLTGLFKLQARTRQDIIQKSFEKKPNDSKVVGTRALLSKTMPHQDNVEIIRSASKECPALIIDCNADAAKAKMKGATSCVMLLGSTAH